MRKVIIVLKPKLEVYGNFKKLCDEKGYDILPYHTLKSKTFPIKHEDYLIDKKEVR